MIYLAVPYTGTPEQKEWRFRCANHVAGVLFQMGIDVFSPISHAHPIALATPGLDGSWERWAKYDKKIIAHLCEGIYVLALDGWETSTGVQAEIAFNKEIGGEFTLLDPTVFGIDEQRQTIVMTAKDVSCVKLFD